uniref:DUF1985 domain-containing protein n=1 Tax=Noccaea caerulescens TaxID=107243 RepID=A0A1J3FWN9_NOCCA
MDAELLKRLYEQGTEPQVDKINNSCKTSILDFLSAKMPDEYNAVKRDPVFAPVFAIHENHIGFSATLVHSMMSRQLLTAKKHELWFVFARRPSGFFFT